jgi:hypothetical protein
VYRITTGLGRLISAISLKALELNPSRRTRRTGEEAEEVIE